MTSTGAGASGAPRTEVELPAVYDRLLEELQAIRRAHDEEMARSNRLIDVLMERSRLAGSASFPKPASCHARSASDRGRPLALGLIPPATSSPPCFGATDTSKGTRFQLDLIMFNHYDYT
jgi:hypothetical protein